MAEKMDAAQENQNIIHPVMFRKWVQETFLEVLGSHVCPKFNTFVKRGLRKGASGATDLQVITLTLIYTSLTKT